MPLLRVDDEVIAEIDQATADMLIGAASFGIGRIRRQQPSEDSSGTVPAPAARSYLLQLAIEFTEHPAVGSGNGETASAVAISPV